MVSKELYLELLILYYSLLALLYEIYVVVIILRKTKNRPEYNEDKKVLFLYPITLFSCWILLFLVRQIEVFTGYKM